MIEWRMAGCYKSPQIDRLDEAADTLRVFTPAVMTMSLVLSIDQLSINQ
jgi:hypothetical protein